MYLRLRDVKKIPELCLLCGAKLYHVNALDTKCGLYIVYCKKDLWCQIYAK